MLSTFLFAHRRNKTAERRVPVEGTPVRLRVPVTSLFFVICLCFASYTLTAESLDQWHRRNPLPTADRLYGVAFGHNTFVAVGLGGATASSMDGTNWVSVNSGSAEHLYGVTYGGGTFVAVGASGKILYSDGTNWNGANSGSAALLNAVTYGGGTFVAIGDVDFFGNATILTSGDGVSWNPADSGVPGLLTAVTYGNRSFVAVGETGLILGDRFSSDEFAEEVLKRWRESQGAVATALEQLGDELAAARSTYEEVKTLDETLFAKDYESL